MKPNDEIMKRFSSFSLKSQSDRTLKIVSLFVFSKIYYFLLENPSFLYTGDPNDDNGDIPGRLVTYVLGFQPPPDFSEMSCQIAKEILDDQKLTQAKLKQGSKHHYIRFSSDKYDILDLFRNIEYPNEDEESFFKDKDQLRTEKDQYNIYQIIKEYILSTLSDPNPGRNYITRYEIMKIIDQVLELLYGEIMKVSWTDSTITSTMSTSDHSGISLKPNQPTNTKIPDEIIKKFCQYVSDQSNPTSFTAKITLGNGNLLTLSSSSEDPKSYQIKTETSQPEGQLWTFRRTSFKDYFIYQEKSIGKNTYQFYISYTQIFLFKKLGVRYIWLNNPMGHRNPYSDESFDVKRSGLDILNQTLQKDSNISVSITKRKKYLGLSEDGAIEMIPSETPAPDNLNISIVSIELTNNQLAADTKSNDDKWKEYVETHRVRVFKIHQQGQEKQQGQEEQQGNNFIELKDSNKEFLSYKKADESIKKKWPCIFNAKITREELYANSHTYACLFMADILPITTGTKYILKENPTKSNEATSTLPNIEFPSLNELKNENECVFSSYKFIPYFLFLPYLPNIETGEPSLVEQYSQNTETFLRMQYTSVFRVSPFLANINQEKFNWSYADCSKQDDPTRCVNNLTPYIFKDEKLYDTHEDTLNNLIKIFDSKEYFKLIKTLLIMSNRISHEFFTLYTYYGSQDVKGIWNYHKEKGEVAKYVSMNYYRQILTFYFDLSIYSFLIYLSLENRGKEDNEKDGKDYLKNFVSVTKDIEKLYTNFESAWQTNSDNTGKIIGNFVTQIEEIAPLLKLVDPSTYLNLIPGIGSIQGNEDWESSKLTSYVLKTLPIYLNSQKKDINTMFSSLFRTQQRKDRPNSSSLEGPGRIRVSKRKKYSNKRIIKDNLKNTNKRKKWNFSSKLKGLRKNKSKFSRKK